MDINIKVTPNAKRNTVRLIDGSWKITLTAPAVDGKANKALIALLAKYFEVRKSQIEITKGLKSRLKTITLKGI